MNAEERTEIARIADSIKKEVDKRISLGEEPDLSVLLGCVRDLNRAIVESYDALKKGRKRK